MPEIVANMTGPMATENTKRLQVFTKQRMIASVVLLAIAGGAAYSFLGTGGKGKAHSEISAQSRRNAQNFTPTASEWATLSIEPVKQKAFRAEYVTEGKVVRRRGSLDAGVHSRPMRGA